MSMPLKELVRYKEDIYELVAAVIKRSQQITDVRAAFYPTTLEENAGAAVQQPKDTEEFSDEKASVVAFKEIFSNEVVYKIRK